MPDPGLKIGISVRELISTFSKKNRRRGMNCRWVHGWHSEIMWLQLYWMMKLHIKRIHPLPLIPRLVFVKIVSLLLHQPLTSTSSARLFFYPATYLTGDWLSVRACVLDMS